MNEPVEQKNGALGVHQLMVLKAYFFGSRAFQGHHPAEESREALHWVSKPYLVKKEAEHSRVKRLQICRLLMDMTEDLKRP